jgi:hypothetical protein
MALTVKGPNVDHFQTVGLHEKQAVATCDFKPSQHLLKTEENRENLCRDGLSSDLPVAHRLVTSSPANRIVWETP